MRPVDPRLIAALGADRFSHEIEIAGRERLTLQGELREKLQGGTP